MESEDQDFHEVRGLRYGQATLQASYNMLEPLTEAVKMSQEWAELARVVERERRLQGKHHTTRLP